MSSLPPTPVRLNLKRDEKLEIDWQDGVSSVYTIGYLRAKCPCATCKEMRDKRNPHALLSPEPKKSLSLSILPGDHTKPLSALSAELVGGYALRIEWSDQHGSGIYSFQYLRDISPPKN